MHQSLPENSNKSKGNVSQLLAETLLQNKLLHAVLSSPNDKSALQKLTVKPVSIAGELRLQLSYFYESKVLHQNMPAEACLAELLLQLPRFKQALICTIAADYQFLVSRKGKTTLLTRPPSHKQGLLLHNRTKHRMLEGAAPFLVELGIASADGKIKDKRMDKFRQINRYLEIVEEIIPHLPTGKRLNIVDFGSGKAYLTFALYHFLALQKKLPVAITGLDLKADVVAFCQQTAGKLGYTELQFQVGEIQQYRTQDTIDLVVSLHACDTATDYALAQAIAWEAKVILAVPCCHKELACQLKNGSLKPLLKHGILRERLAALATEAARAQLLEMAGYTTQVMEFIDMEHTPKNLLIRAVYSGKKGSPQELAAFKETLGVEKLTLEELL